MTRRFIVHYAEIGLKGKNRPDFERRLMQNIRAQHDVGEVARLRGRIRVEAEGPLDLGNVFGVAWWAEVSPVASEIEAIEAGVLAAVAAQDEAPLTFAIRATHADKNFPWSSQEIETRLGALVQSRHPYEVDLGDPDLTVYVEITRSGSFIYTRKNPGPRGLPVGISGKLMGLFSAGTDSAVASYLMAKRGASVELVHFYAMSSAEAAHESKVGPLAARLLHYLPRLTIHYLPYHRFQLATLNLPRDMQKQELVVFRRFMARAAQRMAAERGAGGIYSGDNLGQVASQTLENLAAVDEVMNFPLFRPLIAYDKQEIIDFSQTIGLFELAKQPYKDCCSIIARHPSTVAKQHLIEAIEAEIHVDDLLEATLQEITSLSLDGHAVAADVEAPAA